MNRISFFVPGTPKPAGSKRGFFIKKLNRVVIVDACAKSRDWKTDVSMMATQHRPQGGPLTCPVWVRMEFYMLRPKSHYGSGKNSEVVKESAPHYPTGKPDCLKLARGVEDALTGIIYRDDSLIVNEVIHKRYALATERTGVLVDIVPISEKAL